jgi:hypothetical protein
VQFIKNVRAFIRLVRSTKPAQDKAWRTSAERSAYKSVGMYPGAWKKPSRQGDRPWPAYKRKPGS